MSGTGFNFIDTPNGLLAYYYGYDNQGGKNWLLGATLGPKKGEIVIGQEYTISLNEPADGNGGKFTQKPFGDASGTSSWGTMKLTFTNCNEAVAVLNGSDGANAFNLTKLVANEGTVCTVQ